MKIEVGKKYKTRNGRGVYIQAVATYVRYPGYPFIGFFTDNGDAAGWFNEQGASATTSLGGLAPDTVKKEGFSLLHIGRNGYSICVAPELAGKASPYERRAVFSSIREANEAKMFFENKYLGAKYVIVSFTWEEEA